MPTFRDFLDHLHEKFELEVHEMELQVQLMKKIVSEAKQVGTIYHFTKPLNAKSIIISNKISAGKQNYISFTRNPRLPDVNNYFGTGEYVVRFAFDGNKMSENLKIIPHQDKNYPGESEEAFVDWDKAKSGLPYSIKLKYLIQVDVKPSEYFTSEMLGFIGDLCKKHNIKCNFVHSWTTVKE